MYRGIEFEGSPKEVFWTALIQPYLKDLIARSYFETRTFCTANQIDPKLPLDETARHLSLGAQRLFSRMADIDRRLRGKGFPSSVDRRPTDREEKAIQDYIDQRKHDELGLVPKPKSRWNRFYHEQQFLIWVIGTIIAIATIIVAAFQ